MAEKGTSCDPGSSFTKEFVLKEWENYLKEGSLEIFVQGYHEYYDVETLVDVLKDPQKFEGNLLSEEFFMDAMDELFDENLGEFFNDFKKSLDIEEQEEFEDSGLDWIDFLSEKCGINIIDFRGYLDGNVKNNFYDLFDYDVLVYKVTEYAWDDEKALKEFSKFVDEASLKEKLNDIDEGEWFLGGIVNAGETIKKKMKGLEKIKIDANDVIVGTVDLCGGSAFFERGNRRGSSFLLDFSEITVDTGDIGDKFSDDEVPWKYL